MVQQVGTSGLTAGKSGEKSDFNFTSIAIFLALHLTSLDNSRTVFDVSLIS